MKNKSNGRGITAKRVLLIARNHKHSKNCKVTDQDIKKLMESYVYTDGLYYLKEGIKMYPSIKIK